MTSGWTALAIGLLLAAAVTLGLHWLWRTKINRCYLKSFAEMLFPIPGRISLHPADKHHSPAGGRVENRAQAFRQLGFEDLTSFYITEIPGACLYVLTHPSNGMVAIVHQHPCLGTWSDVMLFSGNGAPPSLASNILKHAHFRFLPGDPKSHHADAPESELVRVISASGFHEISRMESHTFPRLYEKAYTDAADLRTKDSYTENEIRRLLKDLSPDSDLTDADIRGIRELLPEFAAQDWRRTCLWEFLAASGISAREWNQARGKVLVVHEHTSLRHLRSCPAASFLTPELRSRLKRVRVNGNPRDQFASLNDSLPSRHRYKRIGQVAKPVPADIYRAPLLGGPG